MTIYKMPEQPERLQAAAAAEIRDALAAARCSVRLAGMQTEEFVVRELLLAVVQQLDRAAADVRRLYGSP
jgi:hypothetical protein